MFSDDYSLTLLFGLNLLCSRAETPSDETFKPQEAWSVKNYPSYQSDHEYLLIRAIKNRN